MFAKIRERNYGFRKAKETIKDLKETNQMLVEHP
jgi:hypothetical protein